VIGLAYIQRGGRDKQVYAEDLVQTGIFAHSRNPLYLGNLLIVVGLVLVHGGRWMYLVVLPFFLLVYVAIVAAEEEYLLGRFGARYADYCRRVPRFRLRLAGLPATVRSMRFEWRRLVRKEYGTLFSTVTAVLALIAWRRVAHQGFEAARPDLWPMLAAWGVALALYLTARVLKKRRVLADPPAAAPAETTP
jgi:hypothetical protein